MTRLLARSAFFLSGVAGLTFEIVWLRHLGWAVGATTLAVATTTAAYMGGLALGSHLGGRLADRLRRPLAVYGALEIGIALVGIAVPFACKWIPGVAGVLADDSTGAFTRSFARFLVALVVLIVPTTAMGMTLPILARAVTERLSRVGREVGVLYALNIAGAMVGAALTGFVLVPRAGLLATNMIAVGLDLCLGTVAFVAGWRLLAPLSAPQETTAAPVLRPGNTGLVILLLVTGASAMALQVLWTRALGTALGPSTYAFSAIVVAYLAGLAIGGSLAAWVSDRLIAARYALALVLLGTALACLFGIAIVDDLPLLLQRVVLDPKLSVGGLFRTEFALAALSLLPATIGMGAIFPLTLSAVVGSEARLGAAVGRAYALNTIGNIVGSTAAVFVLLPVFGVENGMRAAAVGYVLVAAVLVLTLEASVMPRVRRLLVAAVGVAGLALYAWPGWDVGKWTAGMFRMSMTRYYYDDGDFEPSNLVFHEDGLSTTVTVEQDSGSRWVKVNGKIDGSSEGDMPTQVLSGVLPMVLRDGARSIAVIGCGSGVTVGAALRSNPERITLVELESAMIRAAHLFESVNHAFWADPRVTIVEDDGRNFMGRRGPLYDVIISEPSNPWMTGAASLFTVEFFRLASARLNPDGTFLQWLQIYELAPERIASVLKTFQAVFPHVLVFTPALDSNDLLIVGRRTPWQLDWQGGQARFAALAGEMERAEVTDFAELLTQLLFSDREIAALPVEIPLNTDDNAFIEFGAPRDLLTFAEDDPEVSPIDATRGKRAQLLADLGLGPTGAVDEATSAHLTRLAQAYLGQGMLADARAATALALAAAPPAEVAAEAREVGTLADLFEEDDREMVTDSGPCLNDTAYLQALTLLQADEEKKALEAIAATKDFDTRSGAHALLHGFLLYRDSQYGAARQALLRARQDEDLANHQRAIAYYLAKGSFEAGEYQRASDEMIAYLRLPAPVLSPTPKAD